MVSRGGGMLIVGCCWRDLLLLSLPAVMLAQSDKSGNALAVHSSRPSILVSEVGGMSVRGDLLAIGLMVGISAAQGVSQNATQPPLPPPQTGPSAPQTVTVPAGTKVLLSLKSAINTKTAQQGDGVYLISNFPVIGGSQVMIPVGVYVQGVVDRVQRPGRVKGRAQIDMHFTTMIFPNGQVVEVPGVLNSLPGSDGPKVKDSEGTVEQAGSKGRDVGNVLKGAAIGAEGRRAGRRRKR